MLIFQSTLPSLGVGRLRLRGDDSRVYGSDKEHSLRVPEDPFYKQMAADFTKYQISVNLYAFSDKYTDIASLGKYVVSCFILDVLVEIIHCLVMPLILILHVSSHYPWIFFSSSPPIPTTCGVSYTNVYP